MPFYDPGEFEAREMPGRRRDLVVIGRTLQLMLIDRHRASPEGHSHPNEQMIFLLEGEARFWVGDEERTVGPGHVIYIPSDVHHGMELLTPRLRYLEVFSPPLKTEAGGEELSR